MGPLFFSAFGDSTAPPLREHSPGNVGRRRVESGASIPRGMMGDAGRSVMPPEVHHVYVPGNQILPAEERVWNGVELSGQISISTSLEIRGLSKALGVIVVDFDRDDRVIAIREDGFGY
jgi:hypothetical protein